MMLHSEWKKILRKAWSMRLAALAGVLGGVESILPLFVDSMPRGLFSGLSVLAAASAMVARVVAQKDFT